MPFDVRQQVRILADSVLVDHFGEVVMSERPGRCILTAVEYGPKYGEKIFFEPIGVFHSWKDALDHLRRVYHALHEVGDVPLMWAIVYAEDGTALPDFAELSGNLDDL